MYLHIGLNYMIKKKYITGIFDIERETLALENQKCSIVR